MELLRLRPLNQFGKVEGCWNPVPAAECLNV